MSILNTAGSYKFSSDRTIHVKILDKTIITRQAAEIKIYCNKLITFINIIKRYKVSVDYVEVAMESLSLLDTKSKSRH